MNKLLMIVDPQNDFILGSLPVPGAVEAMIALAQFLEYHPSDYKAIIVTRDNHPSNHCSFTANGGQWPEHCVTGTPGAEVWTPLKARLGDAIMLNKGEEPDREEYSIFANAEAARYIDDIINRFGIEQIDICGLAGDICVAQTKKDGQAIYGPTFFNLLKEYSPTIS